MFVLLVLGMLSSSPLSSFHLWYHCMSLELAETCEAKKTLSIYTSHLKRWHHNEVCRLWVPAHRLDQFAARSGYTPTSVSAGPWQAAAGRDYRACGRGCAWTMVRHDLHRLPESQRRWGCGSPQLTRRGHCRAEKIHKMRRNDKWKMWFENKENTDADIFKW